MGRRIVNRSTLAVLAAATVLGMVPTGSEAAPLDHNRRRSLGAVEMGFFRSGVENDVFYKESGYYGGQWYEIYKSNADPDLETKIAAVQRAVKTISDRGVSIPYGLRVYLTGHPVAQNRAFPRNERFEPVALVTLKWAGPGGVGNSISSEGFLDYDRPTISLIHEIGHILHERSLGDPFWESGSIISGSPKTGASVSGYAGNSRKEFVAEVFTGLILGKVWPTEVMNEYRRYRGPVVPGAR